MGMDISPLIKEQTTRGLVAGCNVSLPGRVVQMERDFYFFCVWGM
jgi:hypothetical protein